MDLDRKKATAVFISADAPRKLLEAGWDGAMTVSCEMHCASPNRASTFLPKGLCLEAKAPRWRRHRMVANG